LLFAIIFFRGFVHMSTFLHPLARSADWIKRRLAFTSNSSVTGCASPSCTELKKYWTRLRSPAGIVFDSKFYCQPRCLEGALGGQFSRLLAMTQPVPPPNRIPLGLLMVARGKLTHIEVRAALDAQHRMGGGKIGDWFEKLGFASEQDVTAALALQWGCPVVSSFELSAVDSPGSIPLPILEDFQMLPVNYAAAASTLYLAFGQRVDHAALYAIERTLNCRTQPCVARRKSIARQLESMRHLSHPHDVEFVTCDLSEMVRITLSYVSRLDSKEIRVSRVGRFIWLRLQSRSSDPHSPATNLVFCLRASPLPAYPPPFESRSVSSFFPAFTDSLPGSQDGSATALGE
jgi:hypothetical protein